MVKNVLKKRNNFGIFSPQAILVDSPASESLIAIEIAKNLLKYKNKINILGCCSLSPPPLWKLFVEKRPAF